MNLQIKTNLTRNINDNSTSKANFKANFRWESQSSGLGSRRTLSALTGAEARAMAKIAKRTQFRAEKTVSLGSDRAMPHFAKARLSAASGRARSHRHRASFDSRAKARGSG
ncbi:MAG TPA: hypothetical protein VN823_21595 [Stellaceae bacterium]|nr:hypothetical protein [Stellaceae bacterium]